jgi:DNA segregation ATPase FtsK/SpoIIIE, S-DNA-T family
MITNHMYKNMSAEEQENLFSNFLTNSWSYSKITSFARNEKAFEMSYIYGLYSRRSATTIAGSAYHKALEYYFNKKTENVTLDIVELELCAFEYIYSVNGNEWKLQKTTPTIEECLQKALTTTSSLLRNFFAEIKTYEDNIAKILDVECRCNEWLTINGVDIPLPCNAMIDLVVETNEGKIAIIDHKSKKVYTSDEEMKMGVGIQAGTYVKSYEAKMGILADEVWFIENKYSQNKDKSPQLKPFVITIEKNTLHLYEALLYEPLQRMLKAISDPDYVYLINDSDSFTDKAELYEFWARTMISEVEDFNVNEAKKELVSKRLKKIRDSSIANINPNVIKEFKKNASQFIQYDLSNKNMETTEKIEHILRTFGTTVSVAHTFSGYSSNTYLLEVSAGTKVASVFKYRMDLANAIDVSSVRISSEMVVFEGKSYLSLDVSKKQEKPLLFNPGDLVDMKIPLGKDNFNNTIFWDLENPSTPHALICGATGSGKSVCIKSIIEYALLAKMDEIIIFDPKREFGAYPMYGASVISEIEEIEFRVRLLVEEMEALNKAGKTKNTLVVFDEFADAVANARTGKDLKVYQEISIGFYANGVNKTKKEHVDTEKSLEENLRILLQKGRSIGFRILQATQRADTKIITGNAKVNLPVQICFRVPKEVDSRVVIDEVGAESLNGNGDGLIKSPQYNGVVRFQSYIKL